MTGSILSGVAGTYQVLADGGGVYSLRARGKLRRERVTPLVGDRVRFTPGQADQHGWLEAVMPRKNALTRPPVANIDVIVVTVAATVPAPDLLLVDRLMMCARLAEMDVALAINKSESDPDAARAIEAEYARSDAAVFVVSAHTGEGMGPLKDALGGRVFAFAGQSGAGKSTLLNALFGLEQPTGGLSEKIGRGRHTTRHSELIPLEGDAMALDTPGFSLMDLPLMEPGDLAALMPEFLDREGQCYFSPCAHYKEPGCAVLEAVESGAIPAERHARYVTIYEEMMTRWRDRYG